MRDGAGAVTTGPLSSSLCSIQVLGFHFSMAGIHVNPQGNQKRGYWPQMHFGIFYCHFLPRSPGNLEHAC